MQNESRSFEQAKERQPNMELLRIVAMLMIIGLHYLDKGGILPKWNTPFNSVGYLVWLIEAFCMMSVNVYVLLSGYYGVESTLRLNKVWKLWGQVAFYSILLGGIAMGIGIVPKTDFNLYRLLGYVFPVVTNHYWFATAYIFLLFIMPFLNSGIKQLEKSSLRKIVFGLILLCSVAKTFLPMQLATDQKGYDILWFVVLYLVGAGMRKEIFGRQEYDRKVYWIFFIGSGIGVWAVSVLLQFAWIRTGKLEPFIGYAYSYNHLLCLIGAVGLFGIFKKMQIQSGKVAECICKISGCAFGVYLIHEHRDLRYLWPTWFHTENFAGSFLFIPHMLGTLLVVFAVCALVESLRKRLFTFVYRQIKRDKTL